MNFNNFFAARFGNPLIIMDWDGGEDEDEDGDIDMLNINDVNHFPPLPHLQLVRQDARINYGINIVPQPVPLFFNHPIALIRYDHDGDIDMGG